MSETECLKNLRAGMFDFEVDDKKIIERRAFLTSENRAASRINPETARRIAGLIPENAQFYKIETAEKSGLDEAITDVLFDANQTSETAERAQSNRDYYFNDWEKSYSYSYLDNDFSEQIDETDDEILADKSDVKNSDDLTKVIGAANPNVSVKLFSPKPLPPPLFFDNRKALILSMRKPANLNPKLLESELANAARRLFTVNNQKSDYSWTDFSSGGFPARQMTMPALGWKIFY